MTEAIAPPLQLTALPNQDELQVLRDRIEALKIEALKNQPDPNTNPARLRYLETLIERANHPRPRIRQHLLRKIKVLLAMPTNDPIQQKPALQSTAATQLAALRATLNQAAITPQPETGKLAQLMALQNQELLGPEVNDLTHNCTIELTAKHRLQQSLVKQHTESRVQLALHKGPTEPGPLNSQRLIVQAFTTLETLAPDYLKQYLEYINALLQISDLQTSITPKKKK